jgi:hypothetical protein
MNSRLWIRGLFAAVLAAIANSVTVLIVDPSTFNLFQGGFTKLSQVALVSALVGAALYLKEHPDPWDGDERRANTVSIYTRLGLMLALVCGLSGCANAPPNLTPEATAAFHATRVVKALDLVRDFAVDGEAQTPKVLSTAHARIVVDFHEAAVRTIHAVPTGWKPTVTAALDELRGKLGAEYPQLEPYVNLVKTLIASLP